MNNTISSSVLVLGLLIAMIMGLLAVFYRVPVLKKYIFGEGVR